MNSDEINLNIQKNNDLLEYNVINPLVKIAFDMETQDFQGIEKNRVCSQVFEAIQSAQSVKSLLNSIKKGK